MRDWLLKQHLDMEILHLSLLVTLCMGVHRSSSKILQRQKRWIIDSFTIDESYNGNFPHSLGHVKIEEDIVLFQIHGQGVDKEPRGVLRMTEETGELWLLSPVDHEQYQAFQLTFQAIHKTDRSVHTQLSIIINIVDSNDCAPTFDRENYEISVKESTLQGSELIAVKATDRDLSEKFKKFDLQIVSVIPQPRDVEFYLTQFLDEVGKISFKGCLDHEQADKYTIIVAAKDHGEPQQLSSSCTIVLNIEDENNHLPVITQQKAVVRVKEDQENILLLRVPVTDEDVKDSPSWWAEFHIKEDTDNNFRITTDKKTNEGILYLNKSLDYEKTPVKNITITAKNEAPYYACKVLERSTMGLWKVAFAGDSAGKAPAPTPSRQQVTVIVENVNEAPIFDMSHQSARVMEDTEVGTYLKTFSAKDPDVKNADRIVYKKGKDPAGWVSVDAKTGKVTTTKILDRESSFVNNSLYVATIHAADDGKPPKTATATLSILISDVNDNTPVLVSNIIDLCQSDEHSMARIEASDLDQEPNAGPFNFKLLGDVKDKWSLDGAHASSVNLVKEKAVHSGHYDLELAVADLQGKTAVHSLSVTVCKCSDPTKPNCRIRKSAVSSTGGATVAIILLSLLLIAGLLLLALLFSCKPDKIPLADESYGNLMISNTETQGTDCEVVFDSDPKFTRIQATSQVRTTAANPMYVNGLQSPVSQTESLLNQQKTMQWMNSFDYGETCVEDSTQYSQLRRDRASSHGLMRMQSMGASSNAGMRLQRRASSNTTNWPNRLHFQETMLKKELHKLETQSCKQDEYRPHVYAEEGDSQHNFELDAISIAEVNFDPNLELDYKFKQLASICMPTGNTVYSTQASD
ncbi:cadherin-like protein 26 [Salarias fasciatus]|uniref:B-cadherin-like n=1 Tax=Salarias fasciatus TaxID=181472 RepID=A0A672J929_SALFA|nr:B-cadherin-like [Salarias fasciatus]